MKTYLTLLVFAAASMPALAQGLPSDAPAPTAPARTAIEVNAPVTAPASETPSVAPAAVPSNGIESISTPTAVDAVEVVDAAAPAELPASAAPAPSINEATEQAKAARESQGNAAEK
jgi:hypothetical protein